ncbi:MAG: sortase domain-bontaining protein, partial [Candidatus Flemingiibacterium sp.]
MSRSGKKGFGPILINVGLLFIEAALLLTGYNLWREYRAMDSSRQVMSQLEACIPKKTQSDQPADTAVIADEPDSAVISEPPRELEIPDYVLNPDMEMPETEIDGEEYIGVLRLKPLGLELPVISEWSYPRLKLAPCRYSGTAYKENLIIAGHDYRSHFGRLKELRAGDAVEFVDMDGNRFVYEVSELLTIQPNDAEELNSGEWELTLFTCTPGGR